jgi:predicted DNA-binding antitoxin AbrB/MazE fold protein
VNELEIEAVYEHGTLKLPRELPLREGQKVTTTIHSPGGAVKRLSGLIPWAGNREDLARFLNDPEEGIVGRHDV